MKTETKKIMIADAPDLEPILEEVKMMFDDSTESELIQILLSVGLESSKENKATPNEIKKEE